jgi:hypothetical protein
MRLAHLLWYLPPSLVCLPAYRPLPYLPPYLHQIITLVPCLVVVISYLLPPYLLRCCRDKTGRGKGPPGFHHLPLLVLYCAVLHPFPSHPASIQSFPRPRVRPDRLPLSTPRLVHSSSPYYFVLRTYGLIELFAQACLLSLIPSLHPRSIPGFLSARPRSFNHTQVVRQVRPRFKRPCNSINQANPFKSNLSFNNLSIRLSIYPFVPPFSVSARPSIRNTTPNPPSVAALSFFVDPQLSTVPTYSTCLACHPSFVLPTQTAIHLDLSTLHKPTIAPAPVYYPRARSSHRSHLQHSIGRIPLFLLPLPSNHKAGLRHDQIRQTGTTFHLQLPVLSRAALRVTPEQPPSWIYPSYVVKQYRGCCSYCRGLLACERSSRNLV